MSIRYQDVLRYLEADDPDSWWELYGFPRPLALFTPLLGKLMGGWNASPEALEALAYHLNDQQRQWLRQLAEAANRRTDAEVAAEISEELYQAEKDPRYGESNPERMELAYWKFMVRRGWRAWDARRQFDAAGRAYVEALEQVELPGPNELVALNEAEQEALFATVPHYSYGGAVWCFHRFGMSLTYLPDGRNIYIAGEHEDYYDPDFHIYNDVIVVHPNLEIEIYGYPRHLFRPTDFHSATLVNHEVNHEHIYIIGNVGYHGTREPGVTPVYRLDCRDYQIESVATGGANPGWISRHQAEYDAARHAIKVTGGQSFVRWKGKRQFRKNRTVYWLDLTTHQWSTGARQG